jgi:hypothetical protein
LPILSAASVAETEPFNALGATRIFIQPSFGP